MSQTIVKDPYNIIITGVGGQGNVLASRVLSDMLAMQGLYTTIGETFGSSQRGGSVTSHIRVSKESTWSPQIPWHKADLIVALEPLEGARVLATHGCPSVICLINPQPISPVDVISGAVQYPAQEKINPAIESLSQKTLWIPATQAAVELGNVILVNIVMLGAIAGTGLLPLKKDDFIAAVSKHLPPSKLEINLLAYDAGFAQGRSGKG